MGDPQREEIRTNWSSVHLMKILTHVEVEQVKVGIVEAPN